MFFTFALSWQWLCLLCKEGFYVPPTAKVIRRRDLGLKSHPKDWRSPGSNSGPLVYKAGSLTAQPWRLLLAVGGNIRGFCYIGNENITVAAISRGSGGMVTNG